MTFIHGPTNQLSVSHLALTIPETVYAMFQLTFAAITPASGFVGPTPAVVIGMVAGVVCFIAATSLKHVLGYDDSLDAFGVHGIGGIVGALLTGVFASKEISGLDGSVLIQLKGVAVTVIYGFAASFIILKVIDMTVGLRVTEEQEREGLDISLHGESIE